MATVWSEPASPRRLELVLVLAWVILGVALRSWDLGSAALFRDEAETCMNALTILDGGLPSDHFRGQPIFENILVTPWPVSEEFEFRDASYSSAGVVTYHGWLPLYAVAASLALAGVPPEPQPKGDAAVRRIARAARAPAVVFSLVLILAAWAAARALHGREAGLIAVALAAVAPQAVAAGREARYHAAALALIALAHLSLWHCTARGSWRNHAWAGALIALLFHTHALAAAGVALALGALALRARRFAPLGLAGGIAAVCILPWAAWSGFFGQLGAQPAARSLVPFPGGQLAYLVDRPWLALGALLALGELAWARRGGGARRAALAQAAPAVVFSMGVGATLYVVFQATAPAASYFTDRITLLLLVSVMLGGAVLLAAHLRAAFGERSLVAAALASALVVAWLAPRVLLPSRDDDHARALEEAAAFVRGRGYRSGTRVYALPLEHLPLTVAAGRTVQSVAPVRRSFLDEYPGEVVILETVRRYPLLSVAAVCAGAARAGLPLTEDAARAWRGRIERELVRADLAGRVAAVEPREQPLPPWAAELAEGRRAAARAGEGRGDFVRQNPAVFGAYPARTWAEFWPAFFYRFVDPDARSGERVNYAARVHEGRATILDSTWVVIECPALGQGGGR